MQTRLIISFQEKTSVLTPGEVGPIPWVAMVAVETLQSPVTCVLVYQAILLSSRLTLMGVKKALSVRNHALAPKMITELGIHGIAGMMIKSEYCSALAIPSLYF